MSDEYGPDDTIDGETFRDGAIPCPRCKRHVEDHTLAEELGGGRHWLCPPLELSDSDRVARIRALMDDPDFKVGRLVKVDSLREALDG